MKLKRNIIPYNAERIWVLNKQEMTEYVVYRDAGAWTIERKKDGSKKPVTLTALRDPRKYAIQGMWLTK